MSKVALTADIHFGVPGRLVDITFACRVLSEYCLKTGIDTVVVLGDLFHDRKSLEIDVLATACKFFEEVLQKNQQWITFPGNHDMFLRHSWDITSVLPLRRHLKVIEDVSTLMLDDQRFWVLPFITYEKSYMRVLKKIEEQIEPGDKLLTHIGVCGASLNTCFLLKDWSIVSFAESQFERVYTGHFHSKQKVGENLWYPGSLIPFKFDEGDIPHGFLVYDTETNDHKFVDIWKAAEKLFPDVVPPPQFRTIPAEQLDQIAAEEIKNNIIRVALCQDFSDNEKRDIRDHLKDLGARSIRWLNLMKKLDKPVEVKSRIVGKDLFRAYMAVDVPASKGLDCEILTRLNDEVITAGDELYVVEESEDL